MTSVTSKKACKESTSCVQEARKSLGGLDLRGVKSVGFACLVRVCRCFHLGGQDYSIRAGGATLQRSQGGRGWGSKDRAVSSQGQEVPLRKTCGHCRAWAPSAGLAFYRVIGHRRRCGGRVLPAKFVCCEPEQHKSTSGRAKAENRADTVVWQSGLAAAGASLEARTMSYAEQAVKSRAKQKQGQWLAGTSGGG
eukprot:6204015-Pleurochrysis_carterae.AAC.4